MRLGRSTGIYLIMTLTIVILITRSYLGDVDPYLSKKTLTDNGEPVVQWSEPKYYNIENSYNHLIWFLQISDIHISIFRDPSRLSQFKEFCNITVNSIQPGVVLASGDLTDALAKNGLGSNEILQEWQHYKNVIDQTNVSKKTLWLDIRGNHDNFGILNLESKNNYYSHYSIQGKKHPRSYMYNVKVGLEIYSFIAIDACLKPGLKRPFNFIGTLDQIEIDKIKQLINISKENNAAHVIVFGHYPTSSIISESNIRNILGNHRKNMVYLCGHYHTLLNMVPNMYVLQNEGFLELELADWKEKRIYRLAAIDHGQFSFIDIKHNDWPIALITNPKNVLFMMPQKENLQSIIKSIHVRVLAFSTVKLKTVEVQLDDGGWQECTHVNGPLYVLPWNSTRYKEGIHHITVRVIDDENRKKIVSHSFSLDGSWLSTSILPKLVLMFDIVYIFQFLFFSTLALVIIPLWLIRCFHLCNKNKRITIPRRHARFFYSCLGRKLSLLSNDDMLFYGVIFHTLFMTIGPWAVGELIEGHMGVIFLWGIIIQNHFLPGGLTFVYGFLQLWCFHIPHILHLAHYMDRRLQYAERPVTQVWSKLRIAWHFLPFCPIILIQVILTYFLYLEYGLTAALICPLRIGCIGVALTQFFIVTTMPISRIRSAAWYVRGYIDNNNTTE
ncbi:hypothetical protein P5V15_010422 [Pogonomyrmex californicus]